jgi:hypothetical protein
MQRIVLIAALSAACGSNGALGSHVATLAQPIGALAAGQDTIFAQARDRFEIYEIEPGSTPSMPSDGTAAPVAVASVPAGSSIRSIEFFAGKMYLETTEIFRPDCDTLCHLTARVFEIDGGSRRELAHVEDVPFPPPIAASDAGVFWSIGRDVYRVR